MKGIKFNTTGDFEDVTLDDENPLETAHKLLGGWPEIVRPKDIAPITGFCFLCDEDGRQKGLELNDIGTRLYRYDFIVGDIIVVKEGMTDYGPDLVSMDDEEYALIIDFMSKL